mmetsp:Transcript_4966/g.13739  ORF Transcript_4966/g.13739 Transcript_4966/m.13739 type:complete len:115 (-) Transcript_4966:178-522(-)
MGLGPCPVWRSTRIMQTNNTKCIGGLPAQALALNWACFYWMKKNRYDALLFKVTLQYLCCWFCLDQSENSPARRTPNNTVSAARGRTQKKQWTHELETTDTTEVLDLLESIADG